MRIFWHKTCFILNVIRFGTVPVEGLKGKGGEIRVKSLELNPPLADKISISEDLKCLKLLKE
jgi:hypothetical protein